MPKKLRKYLVDDSFFSNIDTEKKAYFLGLMFADGNLHRDKNKSPTVRLTSINKEILVEFKKALKSTYPIKREYHKVFKKECFKFSFVSQSIFTDLENLGCTERKSLTIEFPKLLSELIPHFIRGYFDGDGTVGYYKTNTKWMRLMSGFCCGSNGFLEKLSSYLPTNKKNVTKRSKDGLNKLCFSSYDSVKLYEYMYKDATIFLDRKKVMFEKYKQRRSTTTISNPEKD